MITYAPITCDELSYLRYENLFKTCFGLSKKFSPPSIDWLYANNPAGKAIGFNAFDGKRLVAHYVCIPSSINLNGSSVKAILSLNTATHPSYQGKGLFTKLAEMTYAAATELDYAAVYGVANANSTPGFIRKLGFQLIGPLMAKLGIGSLNVDFSRLESIQFYRLWNEADLSWRASNPINPIKCDMHRGNYAFNAQIYKHFF